MDESLEAQAHQALDALQQGRHEQALETIDELLKQRPLNATMQCWKTYALLALQRNDEALSQARAAVGEHPRNAEVNLAMAQAAWAANMLYAAQNAYQRALDLSNRSQFVLREYAYFVATCRGAALGEKMALEALAVEPNSAEAWTALGVAQMRQRRCAEAEASLRRALELNEGCQRARSAMTQLLQTSGRPQEAASLAHLMRDDPAACQFLQIVRQGRRQEQVRMTLQHPARIRRPASWLRHVRRAVWAGLGICLVVGGANLYWGGLSERALWGLLAAEGALVGMLLLRKIS